eukprot:TRINITY_DN31833_c0_g1_i1.p1 TRINITY_DN31833_c0_g1~~TRINITY_DN31833_c0_g1_i1.p1  ORF type:complete len:243 (+),score=43.88 TRINITY_DN31833_c0_g1_i1:39-767(+)
MELGGVLNIQGVQYLKGAPIRKLKTALSAAPGDVGSDRTFTYLIAEERMRQGLWNVMRDDRLVGDSIPESPDSPRSPKGARFEDFPAEFTDASTEANFYGYEDSSEISTQTPPFLELHEQDALIAEQEEEIKRLQLHVQSLRTALLGKAEMHREQINATQRDFIDHHRNSHFEEKEKRRVFETASVMTLRNLERERMKDSKKACTMKSPNAYDGKLALERLSVPRSHNPLFTELDTNTYGNQ